MEIDDCSVIEIGADCGLNMPVKLVMSNEQDESGMIYRTGTLYCRETVPLVTFYCYEKLYQWEYDNYKQFVESLSDNGHALRDLVSKIAEVNGFTLRGMNPNLN